jgi:transposase-like protein
MLEASVLLCLQGAIIMNPNGVRKSEQIKLIMECRRSGLSDYQWCQNQGINPGTFYNWVSKLRKAGYSIPDSANRISALPVKQEIVKLDMIEVPASAPAMVEQNVSHPARPTPPCIAAEIECGNIRVRFFNGADDTVIQNTLKCIGGMPHAW